MIHLRSRWTALFLALVLSLSLALPASAAQEDRAQAAHEAAQYAMQYGGAVSVQYALWENGEVTLQGHDGVYSKTENRALTDDDLYGIGSISKTYTAAAMMKLVEQGKVDLDEPVTAYLPDFTMADPRYTQITVRMLLNHSSGLMGGTTNDAFLFGDQGNDDAPSRLLERLAGQTLQAEPGAYSVRLEIDPWDKHYLSFIEEAGAEYVGRMLQWVYFRKKLTDGPFGLFSDIDSRLRHLERVGNPLLVLGLANLAIGITNSIQANAEYAWINLLCATLLHDMAKEREFVFSQLGLATDYSVKGQLLGHLVMGAQEAAETAQRLGVPEEKSVLLQHLILSHHGEPEFGAAVRPMCIEAELLSYLDLIDSRMEIYTENLENTPAGTFSGKIYAIDKKIYNHG